MQRHETVLLSPHPDDAAFSLGGVLQGGGLPDPVVLVTLFGRSNFMRDGGFSPDWPEVTRRRRGEEETFAASLGLELVYHEMPEVSLRDQRLFAPGSDEDLTPPPGLEDAIARALEERVPALVLAPLGLGDHRDHKIVCRSASRTAAARELPLAYYEDLPYAARLSERDILRRVAAVGPGLVPRVFPLGSLAAKLEQLRLYDSQVGEDDLELIRCHHQRRASERIWCSPG